MDPQIFELDDKGIVPKAFENEELFVERGNSTLQLSKEISDAQLINLFEKQKPGYKFFPFVRGVKERMAALRYVKARYGADLSWVRFLGMSPTRPDFYKAPFAAGVAAGVVLEVGEKNIYFPIIGIFVCGTDCCVHELIHVARQSLRARMLEHAGWDDFEEAVAEDKYSKSFCLSVSHYPRMFYRIKSRLRKSFGDRHGYVFSRLEYAELIENILPKKPPFGDPASYIRRFSDSNLKYRILKERLKL